jgi:hypothetical protein
MGFRSGRAPDREIAGSEMHRKSEAVRIAAPLPDQSHIFN